MKTYEIEILYIEDGGYQKREIKVNRKQKPLPKNLVKWIVKDYLREALN